MTVHRKPWISCDRDGCTGTFIGATDATWPDLQRAARAAGWKVERFNPVAHLCPQHNTTAPGSSVVSA